MAYLEALRYLNSFTNYEKENNYSYKKSFELERIENFLKLLKNPQDSLKCLHIAGTKGKGSTCAFIAYILKEAGFRAGLYTSPHLVDFRERIRVLRRTRDEGRKTRDEGRPAVGGTGGTRDDFEGMISKKEMVILVERLRPFIEKYNLQSKYGALTFFEVYTALAFLYFKEKKVDFVVLETGLGGRLDATNTANAMVCAITPISYEHTKQLGRTLREIAAEKAGIIKAHSSQLTSQGAVVCLPIGKATAHSSVVITAPQEKEAMEVIRERCKKVGAKLFEVGKDITCKKTKDGFEVRGTYETYPNLKIGLVGNHQLINAASSIATIEALRAYDIKVSVDSIRKGLYNAIWPGRCEVISRNPLVVLDGAQNAASAKVLKKTIKENFKYRKLILVLGVSGDKDINGISNQLDGLADEIILTKSDNPRAAQPEGLLEYFKNKKTHITSNVKEALALAVRKADAKDLILITGSLFVAGEARRFCFAH